MAVLLDKDLADKTMKNTHHNSWKITDLWAADDSSLDYVMPAWVGISERQNKIHNY
jgi:hypothetical protein